MLPVLFAYLILFAQSLKFMVNFCIVVFVIQSKYFIINR